MRFSGSLAVLVLLTLVLAPSASANVPGSSFEGNDGNLVVDSTKDWESFKGNVAIGEDLPSGGGDDSLGKGSKDDHSTPTVTSGAIPNNKSDLDRFYVATDSEGAFPGKDFLYLGWTRKNTLGTANVSIEVNQLKQPQPPASGPWALNRLAGDLLILFDFAEGGKVSGVGLKVSKWVTAGNPKTACQASSSVPCWGKTQTLGSTVAEGAVNLVPISDPLDGDNALPELTFGEAAINLTDAKLLPNLCVGFGSAMIRSRSSAAFNSELKDFIAPIDVAITRSADPTNARASGSSTGAKVDSQTVLGSSNPVILPDPPGTPVSTSQTGPGGPQMASFSQLNPMVPSDGSVLNADVIRATSTSSVSSSGAKQTSSAEAVDVNILNGLVKADFVRGVAFTEATNRSSGFSSTGSTIKGLVVNGQPVNDVAPNSRIGLPALTFGDGSYVALYELGPGTDTQTGGGVGTTSQPPLGQTGAYAADLSVTMIRVHITDDNGLLPGGKPAEIIVSQPVAHSDFQGIRCTNQEVSGHAFIASATTEPSVAPVLIGFVGIPRSGGAQSQHLEQVSLSGVLTAGTADSASEGTVTQASSESGSSALVQAVCVLPAATGCTVSATVLKAASHSIATASARSSDAADTTVAAKVQGEDFLAQSPNTTIDLKDPLTGTSFGFVILNEQVCDGGADLALGCALGDHAGLTVRGIRAVITVPDNPLGLEAGASVIVTEAHSDATFGS